MLLDSIFHDTKITVQEITPADNTILTGVGVDMKGYEGVAFVIAIEDVEAGTYVAKAQSAASSTYSDAADLEGSAQTFASSDGAGAWTMRVIDIKKPLERYVRPILTVPNLTATTQAVSVIAIQYNPRSVPQSNSGEALVSPAEGTA